MNTQIIAELFAEAAIEAQLNAEQQELIARRLNEAVNEFVDNVESNSAIENVHDDYNFMSTANAR